jgi:hypothetical protein
MEYLRLGESRSIVPQGQHHNAWPARRRAPRSLSTLRQASGYAEDCGGLSPSRLRPAVKSLPPLLRYHPACRDRHRLTRQERKRWVLCALAAPRSERQFLPHTLCELHLTEPPRIRVRTASTLAPCHCGQTRRRVSGFSLPESVVFVIVIFSVHLNIKAQRINI